MKYTLAVSAIAHVLFLTIVVVPAYRGSNIDSSQIINVNLVGGGGAAAKSVSQVAAPADKEPEPAKPDQSKMAYKPSKPSSKKDTKKQTKSSPGKAAGTAAAKAGTGQKGSGSGSGSGSGIGSGTLTLDDQDFRFAYYLEVLRERIGYNWAPPALFGSPSEVVATVYFKISRDGTVSDQKIEKTSSYEIFDRSALRAVKLSDPLPPLPAGFKGRSLGVHFEFQHTPG